MSVFQYYEFRAVDRPLSKAQVAELRSISTRAEISSTRFTNFYTFGDFKGNPETLMWEYFDASLYFANWGQHRLMFRLPRKAVELDRIRKFAFDDRFVVKAKGDHVLLDIGISFEPREDLQHEDTLADLLPIREEILRGDDRGPYIAWLAASTPRASSWDDSDEDDAFADAFEPPVPPGLKERSAAHHALTDFLQLDPYLLDAAAEASAPLKPRKADPKALDRWIAQLPAADKDAALSQLLRDDGDHPDTLRLRLLRDFQKSLVRPGDPSAPIVRRRTLGEIRAIAEAARDVDRRKENERLAGIREEQRKADAMYRRNYLDSLARNEAAKWAEVEAMIAGRKNDLYDEAVVLLRDLREVADRDNRKAEADRKIADLRLKHEKKGNFIDRLRKANLID